jgi:hypothetical protein
MLSPFGAPVRGWSPIVIWIMQRDWDTLPYTEMNWQGKRALPEGRASVVTEDLVPIRAMGNRDRSILPEPLRRSACAERSIGTIRRESLDDVIVPGGRQLCRLPAKVHSLVQLRRLTPLW